MPIAVNRQTCISRLTELKQFCEKYGREHCQTPCILGATGIGKTAMGQELEHLWGLKRIFISPVGKEPGEVGGFPVARENSFEFLDPSWVTEAMKGDCFIVIDEMNRLLDAAVINPLMKLIKEGSINGRSIPSNVLIITNVNPPNGEYEVTEIRDPAFLQRIVTFGLEYSPADYANFAKQNGINEMILGDPAMFEPFDPEWFKSFETRYYSPRAKYFVDKLLSDVVVSDKNKLPSEARFWWTAVHNSHTGEIKEDYYKEILNKTNLVSSVFDDSWEDHGWTVDTICPVISQIPQFFETIDGRKKKKAIESFTRFYESVCSKDSRVKLNSWLTNNAIKYANPTLIRLIDAELNTLNASKKT